MGIYMKAYQLNVPTSVYFGRNILKEVIGEQQKLLKGTILVVTTGRSLIRFKHLQLLVDSLEALPTVSKVVIFDGISANPRLSEVEKGAAVGKKEKVDVVVGFGGGSALDAAKVIAVGAGHTEDASDFFYGKKMPTESTLPIIAIPTTAGTGSELSKAAIITDEERKVKNGIRGTALYPRLAIVDSWFTETVPFKVTMETGFDVLAHAIESYISRAATPYTEMQSEYAIRIVGKYLPRLAENLQDVEAREKMSFASMIMGINLGNASTCLPHRLQYPLGAHTDTSHGQGLAALFPAWVRYEYRYSGEKIRRVLKLLTDKDCPDIETAVERVSRFLKTLHLPGSLREMGVAKAQIEAMAEKVTGNIQNDPAAQEEGVVRKIYCAAFCHADI